MINPLTNPGRPAERKSAFQGARCRRPLPRCSEPAGPGARAGGGAGERGRAPGSAGTRGAPSPRHRGAGWRLLPGRPDSGPGRLSNTPATRGRHVLRSGGRAGRDEWLKGSAGGCPAPEPAPQRQPARRGAQKASRAAPNRILLLQESCASSTAADKAHSNC